MQYFLPVLLISLIVQLSVAPPVNQKKNDGEHDDENKVVDSEEREGIMEYHRYLQEVVQALESDPVFRARLERVDEEDIRTGRIADHLELLNHNVRTKLDELKREELERLRHLATKENELRNGLDIDHLKIPEHVDHTNTHTFEILDLKKLIAKTTKDLAETDRKRREEFKQYELQKKFDEEAQLKSMNDSDRKKYEEELEAAKEKHKKHELVHHPGSKQQLEEVWEKQDHMDGEDFNPKTFFFLHDVDGNGVWDQDEVKALFLKELDKIYAKGVAPDDALKRIEEMERMREHVFNEADINRDGLISYEEFLDQTRKPDFQQDKGWQEIDEQQIYTQEEYEAFVKSQAEHMKNMADTKFIPRYPDNGLPQHESLSPQYVNVPVPQGEAHPQEYLKVPNQNVPQQQQFQQQNQYQPHPGIPQQYPNVAVHGDVPQQYQPQAQHAQMQHQAQFQGQIPQYQQVPQKQHQMPQPPPQVPQKVQQQVPQEAAQQQQQHYQDQVKQQNQGQVPVQSHQQAPVQQAPVQQAPVQQAPVQQAPVQQAPIQQAPIQQATNLHQPNAVNQIPQNIQGNVAPQLQNSQGAQVPMQQQEIHRNQIHTGGKV